MADVNPDYTTLTNKPKINGVTLSGDQTSEALGFPVVEIAANADIDNALGW